MKNLQLAKKTVIYLFVLVSFFSCAREYDDYYEENYYNNENSLTTVAIKNDGKIVVCGYFDRDEKPREGIVITQFNADGKIDSTFADNGMLMLQVDPKFYAYNNSVEVLDNGQILVLTSSNMSGNRLYHTYVYKLNSDGSFDRSFGTNGRKTIEDYSYTLMKVRSNGSIILAGTYIKFKEQDTKREILTQLTVDGQIDNSFNNGEQLRIMYNSYNMESIDIDLQEDGKLLLIGNLTDEIENYTIARILEDGSLDSAFSEDGMSITDINNSNDKIYGVLAVEDSKILTVGEYQKGSNYKRFFLAKYNSNGSLDTTYGINGFSILNAYRDSPEIKHFTKQSNGNFLLIGNTNDELSYRNDLLVCRVNESGDLDENFGINGYVAIDNDSLSFYCRSATIQEDDKILIVGECLVEDDNYNYSYYDYYTNTDFLIMRLNSDGVIDETFGNNGFTTINY